MSNFNGLYMSIYFICLMETSFKEHVMISVGPLHSSFEEICTETLINPSGVFFKVVGSLKLYVNLF